MKTLLYIVVILIIGLFIASFDIWFRLLISWWRDKNAKKELEKENSQEV